MKKNNQKRNVLIVAAHPDDEVLGCGATAAKLAKQGDDVFLAIMGEGITSRFADRAQADPAELKALHAKCASVAKIIGAKDLFLFNLPDNRFDTVALLDVVKKVEGLISKVSPEVIYTHHAGDLNIDHQIVNRAVLTATRPVQGQVVRELYAFEVPSSTEWSFQRLEPVFRPNVFVDIQETLEHKIKAMAEYESESRAFPHPRSAEALRAIALRWGSVAGCQSAEAFELIRAIV
jgi:LmbE family N-acetylglucosaminyl deacetylase